LDVLAQAHVDVPGAQGVQDTVKRSRAMPNVCDMNDVAGYEWQLDLLKLTVDMILYVSRRS